jgi:MFS family permease
MVGSIFGSSLLWKRISDYENMLTLAFALASLAFIVALFANNIYTYMVVFLLFGVAVDGFNISGMNLIIEIAPEEKRPIYVALQTNLSSIGLFFPILGGVILSLVGSYSLIYIITIILLLLGVYVSSTLKKV